MKDRYTLTTISFTVLGRQRVNVHDDCTFTRNQIAREVSLALREKLNEQGRIETPVALTFHVVKVRQ